MYCKSGLLSPSSDESRRLRQARERVQAGDSCQPGTIRDVILASWLRSRAAGVDPGWGVHPMPRVAGRAGDAVDRYLVKLATPVFDFLRDALSVHPHLLMLTGRDARPLALAGSGASVQEGERINAAAGGLWREDRVGTDAVALCHAIGEPVQVHWYEHFALIADPWTGNSCPIRDPDSHDLLGTINLYAYGCISHPQAFELTREAARSIERQLALDESQRQTRVLQSFAETLARAPNDATLCLSRQGRLLAVSPSARQALDLGARYVSRPLLSDILRGEGLPPSTAVTQPCTLELRDGGDRIVRADLHPIAEGRETFGYHLRLRRPRGGSARRADPPADAGAWRSRWRFEDIVGRSPALLAAVDSAREVAGSDLTVLLIGESGTGKELFAHAIHAASERASGPFVSINCGGLGGELLAAELFGYEEGAFTGATRGGRPGKVELADTGTLFLDEVEAMSPAMQVQLLRFLEDRRCLRVGGLAPRTVDVRVVAATNMDLLEMVQARTFRADLYYRLATWPVTIPALRERAGDVELLAVRLLRDQHVERVLTVEALAMLRAHAWPGNVRELRNILLQAGLRARGREIEPRHLSITPGAHPSPSLPDPSSAVDPPGALFEAERGAIRAMLSRHNGRIGETAAALGIHRATLYRKLRRQIVRGPSPVPDEPSAPNVASPAHPD
ncbi:MAG: modulated sigma54 specific transcriptional regulator, Fis family [Panacagrimonas sp.]|nr:sigma 54-interacting transcriptional regulator [Panacagrimonas sp.]MCC2657567.1 modulated sigma54 specific transcriptional regulator, Fis family [Panacagrimonas sp.]